VVTISRSITSHPLATSAPMAASRTHGPLGRLSRAKITRIGRDPSDCRRKNAANAAAIRPITRGVRLPPIVPRMPEIPIIKSVSISFPIGAYYEFAANIGKG